MIHSECKITEKEYTIEYDDTLYVQLWRCGTVFVGQAVWKVMSRKIFEVSK